MDTITDDPNSSDDENFIGLHKAFAVEAIPKNFNPREPPTDGHEYLHHVMYEASKCAPVTIASNLNLASLRTTTKILLKPKLCESDFTPTAGWEDYHLQKFIDLSNLIHKRRNVRKIEKSLRIDASSKQWLKWMEETRPLLSIMFGLSQALLERMLQVLLKYLRLRSNPLKLFLGEWVYAICAALATPLDKSACSDLRDIARELAYRRQFLEKEQIKELRMVNLIICIVVKHFKQDDLVS